MDGLHAPVLMRHASGAQHHFSTAYVIYASFCEGAAEGIGEEYYDE